jgi:hypothetical protein
MPEKRPSNSELLLRQLEEEDSQRQREQGILVIFERDEDAPLGRDDSE